MPERVTTQHPQSGSSPGFSSLAEITKAGADFAKNPHSMDAVRIVQQYRTFRLNCLTTTLGIIDAAQLPQHALVSVRLKRLDSIRRKIRRKAFDFKLGQLDDIIGVRVILPTFQDALAMSERIQGLAQCSKTKDYTREPRQTGYRATHHIMLFQQALSTERSLNVRFEIQVRSFYQHKWAIWSESQGEKIKAGGGTEEEHSELRMLSKRIAHWEENNPDKKQAELPVYVDSRRIAVAWRQQNAKPMLYDDMSKAVQYLNYLETKFPAERGNALLLVGVSNREETEKVLRQTHPLYMTTRVISPEYWMPDS